MEYSRIRIGFNTAMVGSWTVPADKVLFVTCWSASAIAAQATPRTSEFFLLATSSHHNTLLTGIFNIKDITHQSGGGENIPFEVPLKIPSMADVKMSVVSSGLMNVSGHIVGWYEDA